MVVAMPGNTLMSLIAFSAALFPRNLPAQEKKPAAETFRATQQTALADVESRRDELLEVNRRIWELAEIGLKEHKSSALLIETLKQAGLPKAF